MAWILVLLAGVQVGLLAAVIGVLVEDFVVGTVVALNRHGFSAVFIRAAPPAGAQ